MMLMMMSMMLATMMNTMMAVMTIVVVMIMMTMHVTFCFGTLNSDPGAPLCFSPTHRGGLKRTFYGDDMRAVTVLSVIVILKVAMFMIVMVIMVRVCDVTN